MDIFVYADWFELKGPIHLGTLYVTHVKGWEVFSFAYDKDWLRKGLAQMLDQDLQMFSGLQYPAPDKKNFGIFLDSSPDRWGHLIMKRREAPHRHGLLCVNWNSQVCSWRKKLCLTKIRLNG